MAQNEDPPDDFSKMPHSINELRASNKSDGTKWTPREALINLLRSIDSGETIPDKLCIIWHDREGISYKQAGCFYWDLIAMLDITKITVHRDH